jgi:hypothetical protein
MRACVRSACAYPSRFHQGASRPSDGACVRTRALAATITRFPQVPFEHSRVSLPLPFVAMNGQDPKGGRERSADHLAFPETTIMGFVGRCIQAHTATSAATAGDAQGPPAEGSRSQAGGGPFLLSRSDEAGCPL